MSVINRPIAMACVRVVAELDHESRRDNCPNEI